MRPGESELNVTKAAVYNVATGTTRTWRPGGVGNGYGVGVDYQNSLSWGCGQPEAGLPLPGVPGRAGVRVLDTAAPGSGLLATSHVIVRQSRTRYWTQARLTPDGRTVIANLYGPGYRALQQLVEFSARTGKVARVLSEITHLWGDDEQVHWMSPDGQVLIVTDAVAAHAPLTGLVRGRRCRDADRRSLHAAALVR